MSKQIEELNLLILELNNDLVGGGFNTRLIHKIAGFSGAFPEKIQSHILDIIGDYDRFVESALEEPARVQTEKLLGILEGYASFLEDLSSQESVSDNAPRFSLGIDDKGRVLKLCAEMRELTFSSTVFDNPHKKRILDRIAEIEAEIQKEKGKLDVILGGINDIGEAAGKFGEDVKPLTDRINEIFRIARRKTPEYNQIPAPDEVMQIADQSEDEADG